MQAIRGSLKCAAFWVLALLLLPTLSAVGCRTGLPAVSTTTGFKLTLLAASSRRRSLTSQTSSGVTST